MLLDANKKGQDVSNALVIVRIIRECSENIPSLFLVIPSILVSIIKIDSTFTFLLLFSLIINKFHFSDVSAVFYKYYSFG